MYANNKAKSLTISMDLIGPNGIKAARSVASVTCSVRPPAWSVRRDCNKLDMSSVIFVMLNLMYNSD